ncbi:arabinan endo-1,5-alpha-L-arabinosidase [bacterium]|nr:MAG: arabinan endo-1,5-alpha-L-arabinosidase [bacterium]
MKTRFLVASFLSLMAPVLGQQSAVFAQVGAAPAAQVTSGNPVFPGWYADPDATVFDKTYWVYPTFSAPYAQQTVITAFSSPDLVNWTKHFNVIDTNEIKWAKRAVWAPAIVRNNGKYYLFFGANDIQNNNEVGGIGVAVADKPEGPFKDLIGKPLVGQIVNRAQPIDQFVFHDKDGQWYMIYGGWGRCNIVKLKADFTGLEPYADGTIYKEITPKDYVEGPVMFMRNGKYYFMWSEGGWTGPNYRVAYAIGDSPFGPFERIATVLQQDRTIATGAGHHGVINVPGTDDWYMVYHRRPLGETDASNRVTCIDKMVFDEKGFIQPVKLTNEGVSPQTIK